MRLWSAVWAAVRVRGEETPFKPESSGAGDEEDNEDVEEGEITPLFLLCPLMSSPLLVTFSASKRGSPLARVGQDAVEWESGHLSAHRHSPALR
jgi:hypothetical protein